jgi:two-component system response regulator YesN
MILEQKPDIILTDIRMPKMNGLEMVRSVLHHLPESKIILMTGYTDFEYAQQAVKLGAFDFLAKPFSMEEIREVVLRAKGAVLASRQEQSRHALMEKKLKESMPMLRQEYFSLLIQHSTNDERERQRWDFLGIELAPDRLAVLVLEIDDFTHKMEKLAVHEIELIRFSMQNIVEETVNGWSKGVVFRESIQRYVILCNLEDRAQVDAMAEKCREHIEKYTKFTISIGVGGIAKELRQLPACYDQALAALSYHFYTGGNGVFNYQQIESGDPHVPRYPLELEHDLLFALKCGNEPQVMSHLDAIVKTWSAYESLPSPDYFIGAYRELTLFISRALSELIPHEELASLQEELHQRKPLTLTELHERLRALCKRGCEILEQRKRTEASATIDTAIAYIREHLHYDLSVNHCAAQVHLSGSYFANLFKKTTGLAVSQFITQERVERAKEMLIQGYQVQEIASAVGYEERRSFSDVFKRLTGMTPSEFKEHPIAPSKEGDV